MAQFRLLVVPSKSAMKATQGQMMVFAQRAQQENTNLQLVHKSAHYVLPIRMD